jgi:hypothetical protein
MAKRKKKSTKRRAPKRRAAPKRKRRARARSARNPKLIVTRMHSVHPRGFVWSGRYGTQHVGMVVAATKGKATRQLSTAATRALRTGR